MRIEGELAVLIERIMARKANFKIRSLALIIDDRGDRLTYGQRRGGILFCGTVFWMTFSAPYPRSLPADTQ
jgi:hypothetical protein